MEGYCSTGQSPQWVVMPMEEEEDTQADINLSARFLVHVGECTKLKKTGRLLSVSLDCSCNA